MYQLRLPSYLDASAGKASPYLLTMNSSKTQATMLMLA
jgi:hypothetical protein